MSHETKAGVLVSCAFLCMVGAVVYLRMNDSAAPAASESGELPPWPKQQSAQPPTEPPGKDHTAKADAQPGSVAPVAEPPRFEKPPDLQLTGAAAPSPPPLPEPQSKTTPVGGGSPLLAHEPPPANDTKVASGPPVGDAKTGSDAKLPSGPVIGDAKTNGPLTIEPSAPPISDGKTAAEPKIGNDTKLSGGPGANEPPIGSPFAHTSEPPAPVVRMENPPGPTPAAPEPSVPGFTPGAGPAPPPNNPPAGTHDPAPPMPESTRFTEPKPPVEPAPGSSTPGSLVLPPPDAPKPSDPHGPPPALEPPKPPIEPATPTSGAGPSGSGPGGVNLGAPEARAVPPTPGSNVPAGATADPRFAPPPMGNPLPDRPAAAIATVGAGTPGSSPVPLAAPPTVASPPISIGGPLAAAPAAVVRPPVYVDPRVESFDEETYVCKPTDSFTSISQDKYMTDKYANALLTFNRAHPLAADGIRNEPPALKAGQPIYIPPLEILEKRYPALIPDLQPRAANEPKAVGAAPQAPPATPASGNPIPASGAGQSYTVRDKPETFYEIAQKLFGRPERWGAIWELNREFPNPNQPLPVGTVVRLPGQ